MHELVFTSLREFNLHYFTIYRVTEGTSHEPEFTIPSVQFYHL